MKKKRIKNVNFILSYYIYIYLYVLKKKEINIK